MVLFECVFDRLEMGWQQQETTKAESERQRQQNLLVSKSLNTFFLGVGRFFDLYTMLFVVAVSHKRLKFLSITIRPKSDMEEWN